MFVVPPHFKILNHTLLSLAEGASCCFPSLGFQAFLPFDLKELLLAGGSAMLPLYNDLEIANDCYTQAEPMHEIMGPKLKWMVTELSHTIA